MLLFFIQLHYQLHWKKDNYITNYIEKRTITLPNEIGNGIYFNYFSIAQKALQFSADFSLFI